MEPKLTTYGPDMNVAEDPKHIPTKAEWKTECIETLKEAFHRGDDVVVNGITLKVTAVGKHGLTLLYKPERII